jgi:hypothetical protein
MEEDMQANAKGSLESSWTVVSVSNARSRKSAPAADLAALAGNADMARLADCEKAIEKNLRVALLAFYEVGDALLTVQRERLYRQTYATFDDYCRERWGFSRMHAWRLTAAAERMKLLTSSDDMPKPACESQIRPFLKLPPQEFPRAWNQVVKTANGEPVTTKVIRAVANKLLAADKSKAAAPSQPECGHKKITLEKSHVWVLITQARKQVSLGDSEQVLETLGKIEELLYDL